MSLFIGLNEPWKLDGTPLALGDGNCAPVGTSHRDFFAAAALTGLLANIGTSPEKASQVASRAYEIADAMLRARQDSLPNNCATR